MEQLSTRELYMNPYILQMDKLAESLRHLAETFLNQEGYKGKFTVEEIEEIFLRVADKVCGNCENRYWCLTEKRNYTRQMVYEILCTAEDYGAELNTEVVRKLNKRCIFVPEFIEETLEAFGEAKQKLLWNNRLVQSREGCAWSLISFAGMIQEAARELGKGIVTDEQMEKKIRKSLGRAGVKILNCIFYLSEQGKHEVHLTMKARQGSCITTKEIAKIVGRCLGRPMTPGVGEMPLVWQEYNTIVFQETARFHTMQGVAKIGKGCHKISGDTFSMTEMSGQRRGVVLSDGMGSGEGAFQESRMVIEMLEELLKAGFPEETAIKMLNTALVMGREDVKFSTIDMCVFDLYEGHCEFIKAGASTTFLKRGKEIERISSTSLPVGVIQNLEVDMEKRTLKDGDKVIMITDGILDAMPVADQEEVLGTIIQEADSNNPREMAHSILENVLEYSGEVPLDDMTVIVVGVWNL